MKSTNRLFLLLLALPLMFSSCGNNIANQLKKEMQEINSQCPQNQGEGVILTHANFYEKEKILEYVCTIEWDKSRQEVFSDPTVVANMKQGIVLALSGSDVSALEKLSLKTALKTYGYSFRYIYNDTEGKKLCEIVITKDDLP